MKIINNTNQLKKLVAFVFILIALGIYFNNKGITGYAISESRGIDSVISLDVSELKYELITGENKKIVFYIKNHLEKQIEAEIGIAGRASNFVTIEKKTYVLQPGESVPVEIKLTSSLEAVPQLYFGDIVVSAESKSKIVPIQILVKKRVQDAIALSLISSKQTYYPGDQIDIQIGVVNSANEKADVQIDLSLIKNGKEVNTWKDISEVTDTYTKTFSYQFLENAPAGQYFIEAKASAKIGKQFGQVDKKTQINVELPIAIEKPSQSKTSMLWWIVGGIILAALVLTGQVLVKQELINVPKIIKVFGQKSKIGEEEKHYIKERFSYVINEKGTRASYETLRMLHHEGYKVLCITRLNPKLLMEEVPEFKEAKILWLTTQEGEGNLGPTDIEGIFNSVDKFTAENEKSAVLLDGLGFLTMNASFNQVMLLLQYIKDKISTRRSIFIAPLNTSTLGKKEVEQISGEVNILDGEREILLEIYRQDDFASKQQQEVLHTEVSKQLLDYIERELQAGYSAVQIGHNLLSHGWQRKVIEKAFEVLAKTKYGVDASSTVSSTGNLVKTSQQQFYQSSQPYQVQQAALQQQPTATQQSTNPQFATQQPVVIEESLDFKKLKTEFDKVVGLVNFAIKQGKNTAKMDLELALLSGDLEIAGITNDQKDIKKVKTKLDEIKRQLNSLS